MPDITYANIYTAAARDGETDAAFEAALYKLRANPSPIDCVHRIDGRAVWEGRPFERADPVDLTRVVSGGLAADRATVDAAVAAARGALGDWRRRRPGERAAAIAPLRGLLEQRRIELAALASHESGKTRADALAEIDECSAIVELCLAQYEEARGYGVEQRSASEGSRATVVLMPYGVFGVVAPFNFPFAIPLAMTLGALLLGNTVVLKPSSLTPACGDALVGLLGSAGLPPGALNVVHGTAETGRHLVDSEIDGLAFTGSAEVGLGMAARLRRPPYTRPLIAEMGGKNPAIVSEHAADVGTAAAAVARSAFGMSGQKCNACSRAIVAAGVYEEFVSRLVEFTESLTVADPAHADAFTGPVVSAQARDRFARLIEGAGRDGTIRCGGGTSPGHDAFVQCTVVDGLPRGHELTREEAFLPLLTVTCVRDLDDAIAEANDVRYGLSAGLFSDDETEQRRFLDEIEAGIVFVNNPGGATTGVWPGSQTMSGWKASGATGKGGFGPWYLQQFGREQSRTVFHD